MFRIVTKNTDEPALWLVCDHRNCSASAHRLLDPASLSEGKQFGVTQNDFILGARKGGWQITLDLQLYPNCSAEMTEAMREMAERKRQLVEPVTGARAERWNGKLVNIKSN